jgi:simple sugar transport system ATP-binding protein
MSLAENAALGFQDQRPFSPGPYWLSARQIARFARELVARYRVRAASVEAPMGALSGGNQQKLVVAREMARQPRLMIAAQPTRGLDLGAAAFVYQELGALRDQGGAVLLVSLDLTEIMLLADRIAVIAGGKFAGWTTPGEVDSAQLGAWMTGATDANTRSESA